jgi:hypothetical protein
MEFTGMRSEAGQSQKGPVGSHPMPALLHSTANVTRRDSRKNGLPVIGRHNTVLYQDPNVGPGKRFLLDQISRGFDRVTSSVAELARLPDDIIPVVGCQMEVQAIEDEWRARGRTFVYWDRGYLNRGGKTWLRRNGPEYFRWHVNSYQMKGLNPKAQADRFARLRINPVRWRKGGRKVVIAAPSPYYAEFHRLGGWLDETARRIRETGRKYIIRQKRTHVPLYQDLADAYCLVTHGSVAAIEAAVWGYPVIVAPSCAAAPIGRTSLDDIEDLVYPDRTPWLQSLAYSQFTADEVADGTIWEHLT